MEGGDEKKQIILKLLDIIGSSLFTVNVNTVIINISDNLEDKQ